MTAAWCLFEEVAVESANAVSLMVVVLEERAREALDARYGVGAVQATAALTPVA